MICFPNYQSKGYKTLDKFNKTGGNKNMVTKQINKKVEQLKSKPVQKFKLGSVMASVWRKVINKNENDIEIYSVSLNRCYMDKSTEEFKYTDNMRENDIPKAIIVLQKAYEWLNTKEDDQETDDEVEE